MTLQTGRGHTPDPAAPAKLQVHLIGGAVLPLWVFDTDYSSWAIVYSCALQLGALRNDQVGCNASRPRKARACGLDGLWVQNGNFGPQLL
jgi:hypothetical protein